MSASATVPAPTASGGRTRPGTSSYSNTSRSSSSSSSSASATSDVTAGEVTSGEAPVPVLAVHPSLLEAMGHLPRLVFDNSVAGVASVADAEDAEESRAGPMGAGQ